MSCELFEKLFIFDMANNHQGDLEHGLSIISEVASIAKEEGISAGIKFQFRQLDSFIHPDYLDRKDIKHIPRFVSTRLLIANYKTMVSEAKRQGLITICTPFDEESLPILNEQDIDVIKIGSCSLLDWPLLAEVAKCKRPVVISTGGGEIDNIDKVVSFFSHKGVSFALMHCVSIYPTKKEDLQLNQISFLKNRYPFLKIGFSTHESPDQMNPIQIAVAKGASLFERHVGIQTDSIKLNAYSSTPAQAREWVRSAKMAFDICGSDERLTPLKEEIESIESLKRGVFARRDIYKGETITRDDIFFAMPCINGYADSSMLNYSVDRLVAKEDMKKNAPIPKEFIVFTNKDSKIYSVIHKAKGLLYEGRITIGKSFNVTLSHHKGLEFFDKSGAIIIDIINRKYCKKLIIQVAGQFHPIHFHKKKEETFQVLYGETTLEIEGIKHILKSGDMMLVKPGQKHSFWTKKGVIIEEVSTTHFSNDSFYCDDQIENDVALRKTKLENAGHTFEQYNFMRS